MLISGKIIRDAIKEQIKTQVHQLTVSPRAVFVVVGNDPVTEQFLGVKERFANEVGIVTDRISFPCDVSNETLIAAIEKLAQDTDIHAIVVQLPLPSHILVQNVLDKIPVCKDVDVLSTLAIAEFRKEQLPILPPVAGAVQAIFESSKISVAGKDVLVLGHGKLVGAPVALLMRHNHANVTVIDKPIADLCVYTKDADIIITGVGKAGIITPEMIKQGVVLVDAGTSEQGGKVVGDVDYHCEEKASIMTPVPGGVGPVTVAMLMKNIVICSQRYASK